MATVVFGSGFRAPREERAARPVDPAVGPWVLVVFGVDGRGEMSLLWSPDREQLEAFARARQYKKFWIVRPGQVGESPVESPRSIAVSLLDVPTKHGATSDRRGRNFIAELRCAGHITLGHVADAGVDGLRALKFPGTVIRRAEASLRQFGLELQPAANERAA